jgi:hypothetical protein
MTNAEQVTGARDEHYDLVSVLDHTMQESLVSADLHRRCSVRRRQRPRRLLRRGAAAGPATYRAGQAAPRPQTLLTIQPTGPHVHESATLARLAAPRRAGFTTLSARRATTVERHRPQISRTSESPEINRARTWTFQRFSVPIVGRTGKAPARWRHKTWSYWSLVLNLSLAPKFPLQGI